MSFFTVNPQRNQRHFLIDGAMVQIGEIPLQATSVPYVLPAVGQIFPLTEGYIKFSGVIGKTGQLFPAGG